MINLTREEAQHVLDELLHLSDGLDAQKAIELLRTKLSEPEPEPVAWKQVIGYEGCYEVSSAGDLRSVKINAILAKSLMGAGYVKADLWKNGVRQQTSVHRLVAEAFLEKPEGATEINHKNGIKTDNRVTNLEWVSRAENVNHSYYSLGNNVKPIIAKNIKNGEEKQYPSVEAAVRDGFHSAHISSVLAGKRKQHKGHTFVEAAPPQRVPAGVNAYQEGYEAGYQEAMRRMGG